MTSLNISLPDPLKAYVEERVATGDFGTPSEFIRNLIRQDKELRRSRLETELFGCPADKVSGDRPGGIEGPHPCGARLINSKKFKEFLNR